MITRRHDTDQSRSAAVYSDCECYRYSLSRIWARKGGQLCFVMLNPSTASERHNDPTVERCERRARAMGHGGVTVVNLFAWRATDPRDMRAAPDPVGPDNDTALLTAAAQSRGIIAAWGIHGAHRHRGRAVAALLRAAGHPLRHLGLTLAGHPRHPLYLPYSTVPQIWRA